MADLIKKLIHFASSLFVDSNVFIEDYLRGLYAEELESCVLNKDKGKNRCVYEEHLDDKEYVDRDNNPNGTTIRSIICPDQEHIQEKQLLCISAAPGYGKEFFAKRLCLLDYVAYNTAPYKGRVPFIIKPVDVSSFKQIKDEGGFRGGLARVFWTLSFGKSKIPLLLFKLIIFLISLYIRGILTYNSIKKGCAPAC